MTDILLVAKDEGWHIRTLKITLNELGSPIIHFTCHDLNIGHSLGAVKS